MGILPETIRQYMGIVYFIYGASFFLLGAIIIVQYDANSKFIIGRYFWLLGMFGILHGFNEWVDMLLFYQSHVWAPNMLIMVAYLKNILFTATSFIFLLQFGICCLVVEKKSNQWMVKAVLWISIILLCIVMLVPILKTDFFSGSSLNEIKLSEILMRYFIGFPAALLTGIAFLVWRKKIKYLVKHSKYFNIILIIIGYAFVLYAILSGLIVPQSNFFPASIFNYQTFTNLIGFPVQFFRTLCAIVLTIFVLCVLHMFNIEERESLV